MLNDHYLIEQMANFNRERIPEQQPHAKGGGAFGHFQVTQDVSRYTRAAVFQPGTRTETLIRFSTVAGERGSPDTWRDPRGFSLKFYTSEGIYDMVGDNARLFHSGSLEVPAFHPFAEAPSGQWPARPRHAMGLLDAVARVGAPGDMAHGRSRHPKTWRHMNGYSSHTYMWVNAQGAKFWVKYHFKTDQGVDFLTQAEADRLAGADGDYHRRDLYDSIKKGELPHWTLKMQIMPFEAAKTYRFNPFDLTKVWPHKDYPLIEVGQLTLDRNVTDFHTEIEQAAFEPNNLVPGIGLSPDKMLLARGFSYSDAHRARLGVNYKQIPVNRPKSPVHSYSKDGAMRCRTCRTRVRAEFVRWPAGRPRAHRRGGTLVRRRRHGAQGVHPARRGR